MLFTSLCKLVPVLILAQADRVTLPDPKSAEAVGWLVLTVAAAAVTFSQIVSGWQKLFPRQTPPNHEVYATKAELAKLEKDHEEEMGRIEERFEKWLEQNDEHHQEEMRVLNEWKESMAKWQTDIASAMGRLHALFELALKKRGS